MPKCSFCGNPLPEGRGKMLVKTSGQVLYFCNSKCQRNYELGRNPKKLKWVKKKKSKCKYICCAIEDLDDHFEIASINWSKTILLCTGHTLPHFEPQLYLTFLAKYFPKYLFIDFYHNFDEVISSLESDGEESVVEPRIIVKDNSYALVTKADPTEKVRILSCLLYTSPSPRDLSTSRMPSSA